MVPRPCSRHDEAVSEAAQGAQERQQPSETVVGQFAQASIAKKEARNRFVIRTDKPRVDVSWQVTARRSDSYLRAHPFQDTQSKTKADNDLTARMGSRLRRRRSPNRHPHDESRANRCGRGLFGDGGLTETAM